MTGKEQYYALDEIGFIGVQDRRSKAKIKKDREEMNQYVKARRAEEEKRRASKKRVPKTK